MVEAKHITIFSNKQKIVLNTEKILYVIMSGNNADIHMSDGTVHKARITFSQIEAQLGDSFVIIHRGVAVSVKAIHEIKDKIYLINGESLVYTVRKKKQIIEDFQEHQRRVINSFYSEDVSVTREEYIEHYKSFEELPFAFTDIELVFDDEVQAVDWIFRYGNPALASLEKVELDKLIGHSFKSVFPNMDSKWLRAYERATLYGETLEIIDYSLEIDTNLKVICFPTFRGHCGCLLFNIGDIRFMKSSDDAEKALMLYYGQMLKNIR